MNLSERLDSLELIFLDTAVIIYFVEKNPEFFAKVQPIFSKLDDGSLTVVVSPITLAECLVLPYRGGNPEVAQIFSDLMVNNPSVLFLPIDEIAADKAADLRARYNISLTDALQIAVAIQSQCGAFVTNDLDLKRVSEIPIIVLSEVE
ncbi:MAG: VapC toxin family PIN domain ribonuclease [Chloroflexi bacterium]|nr:PIN domain-containing protein [Anaerolineales bacterium]RIK51396.1 MAG: VapC toxin family PIN domain ribonuclease [Chloroflexota bacterium]